MRTSFLQRLFQFRRIFHSLATTLDHSNDIVAVVCWVDHLFAKLGDVILASLDDGGLSVQDPGSVLHTITKHRQESALHAASQLPRELPGFSSMNYVLTYGRQLGRDYCTCRL